MVTVEYRCADGTPFPVEFESDKDAARTWRYDREHSRDPLTPLGGELDRIGVVGGRRAADEVGIVLPPAFAGGVSANGFPYFSDEVMPAEDMATMFEGCGKLVMTYGSANGIWHGHSLPRVKDACATLASASTDEPLQDLAELAGYAFQLTMIPAYVAGNDIDLLAKVCAAAVGGDGIFPAYELTQGFDNETLRADIEMFGVAQTARAHPPVLEALAGSETADDMRALRGSGEAAGFFEALDRFLDTFGDRAESWDIAAPTWSEQRDGLWAQIRQLARVDAPDPTLAVERAAERREKLTVEIAAKLADDADNLGRFERRVARVREYVAVREERAMWQLIISGSLRRAMLRRGAALVARGHLDADDDVLYLLPDELEHPDSSMRDRTRQRRADHEVWKTKTPPLVVGGSPGTDADAVPAAATGGTTLRGVAASRGVATGTARVVTDLVDADRIEPGDVLVCVMTAPPWTPLFGLVAAVVADSGAMGSHPAIAAREYGIPCVLGTHVATQQIADGALVTVDGTAGTVEVNLPLTNG